MKALAAHLRPLLGQLRGASSATLSEPARDVLLKSRMLLHRMQGDATGMEDASGSHFLMSLAGACKVEGAEVETFAELAYAASDARAHLDKQESDAMDAPALARAWLRAAPQPGQGSGTMFSEDAVARAFADAIEETKAIATMLVHHESPRSFGEELAGVSANFVCRPDSRSGRCRKSHARVRVLILRQAPPASRAQNPRCGRPNRQRRKDR